MDDQLPATTTTAPCPFCEADGARLASKRKKSENVVATFHAMSCLVCGADGPIAQSEDQAIARWNSRTPSKVVRFGATPLDEQFERAAIQIWHRFAVNHGADWNNEPHRTEYKKAANSAVRAFLERANSGMTIGEVLAALESDDAD